MELCFLTKKKIISANNIQNIKKQTRKEKTKLVKNLKRIICFLEYGFEKR
jgi:RNase P subunit RPR2